MVDYSKWDKLDVSSDEESKVAPKVTKFDKAQTIQFGQGLVRQVPELHDSTKLSRIDTSNDISDIGKQQTTDQKRFDVQQNCVLDFNIITRNGGTSSHYLWSQTKDEVAVHIPVPRGTKGRNIVVTITKSDQPKDEFNMSSDTQRHLLDNLDESSARYLKVMLTCQTEQKIVLEGQFPHSVKSDDSLIFWELKTFSSLVNAPDLTNLSIDTAQAFKNNETNCILIISLTKSIPIANMTIWWKQFLIGDPVVDTSVFGDRRKQREGVKGFKDVWDEAHKLFLEKMKDKGDQRIEISEQQISSHDKELTSSPS